MFNSTVMDVAVGLIFTFLAVSLIVSAMVETLASMLKWRANTLLAGVKALLNDPDLQGLALNIYNNGLVSPRGDGQAQKGQKPAQLPSYIDPKQFADALLDVTSIAKAIPANIRSITTAIDANVTDPQLNGLMKGIARRTAGDLGKMRDELAAWFDNGMDRVSGVYKRQTQVWSFAIALVTAGLLNVSTIEVVKALWQQPMLAKAMVPPKAGQTPSEALTALRALPLPIGWTRPKADNGAENPGVVPMVFGWLLTAFATLFGAPFWFDALQQIVRLKGAGPSPAEKRSGTGAAN